MNAKSLILSPLKRLRSFHPGAKWLPRIQAIKRDVWALCLAYRDPRTPWYAKALTIAVVAYTLSPIDLVPDFIPFFGLLDDVVLVPLGIYLAIRMIPHSVMVDCRARAHAHFKLAKRYVIAGVLGIVAVWVLALLAVWMLLLWLSFVWST